MELSISDFDELEVCCNRDQNKGYIFFYISNRPFRKWKNSFEKNGIFLPEHVLKRCFTH